MLEQGGDQMIKGKTGVKTERMGRVSIARIAQK